jgi:signal transduction histidine kinase
MKDSNWCNFVHVFIDPALKNIDKELYQFLLEQFNKEEYNLVDFDQNQQTRSLSTIAVIPADQSKRTLDINCEVTIALRDKNMSLFAGSEPLDTDFFAFHDERDFYDLMPIVRLFLKEKIQCEKEAILNNAVKNFKKYSSAKAIKEKSINKSQLKILDNLERSLYHALDSDELNSVFNEYETKVSKQILITDDTEIFKNNYELYFPIEASDFTQFLIFLDSKDVSLLDLYVFQALNNALDRVRIKREGADVLAEIEEVFSKINIPIAVFDKKQHLVLHNAEFVNLNISAKKVNALKVNDQVTLGKEVYRVQKVFLQDGEFTHINFIPVREFLGQSGSPSSEELGIVSSSIAHELNNPLGGILAALNVIELDEHSDETLEKIAQMREGVLRCKKLVETFLGFSKIKPASADDDLKLQECYNQAMDLVRFRLIENNIVFNSEYNCEKNFEKDVNPYVISMIFYLFFGEILTNYSHQKLVTQKNSPKINLNFLEKEHSFEFELLDNLKVSDNFVQSKLIQHLLETQGLHMAHDANKCHFY